MHREDTASTHVRKVKPGREGGAGQSALCGCGGSGGGASGVGAASRCTISLNRPGRPSALDHQDCQAAVRLYPVRNVCRQIARCQSSTGLRSPLLEQTVPARDELSTMQRPPSHCRTEAKCKQANCSHTASPDLRIALVHEQRYQASKQAVDSAGRLGEALAHKRLDALLHGAEHRGVPPLPDRR